MIDFTCNTCEKPIDINDFELYELYDTSESLHEIECPHCGSIIYVRPVIQFDFVVCDEDGEELF